MFAHSPAAQEARAIKARQEMKRMPTRMVVCVSHLGFLPQLAFDRPYNKDDKVQTHSFLSSDVNLAKPLLAVGQR